MRHPLPIPADFTEHAPTARNSELTARYGVSESTIQAWRRKTGIPGKARPVARRATTPTPPDFAANAARMTQGELIAHYRMHRSTVVRMCVAAGVEPLSLAKAWERDNPPPEGFADVARTMHLNGIVEHYGVSVQMARMWCRVTGAVPKPFQRPVPHAAIAKVQRSSFLRPQPAFQNHVTRDDSLEGRAADHLRRYGPVWRCADERGRFDPKGELWRVGNRVLTAAELIERAERKGFERDGWRQLGAAISEHERDRRIAA